MNQSPAANAAEQANTIAEQLLQDGVATFPVPGAQEKIPDLLKYIANQPEVPPAERGAEALTKIQAGGGFAALNTPSSFHNKAARELRTLIYHVVRLVLEAALRLAGLTDYNFEQLVDRMLYRQPSQKAMKESAHQDSAAAARLSDLIFGGWLAGSHGDRFICSPGTHRDATTGKLQMGGGAGFTKITKADGPKYPMTAVPVPKGHFVMFFSKIVHEVQCATRKGVLLRLFVGHRLTQSIYPLHHEESPILKKNFTRPAREELPTAVPSPPPPPPGSLPLAKKNREKSRPRNSKTKGPKSMKGVKSPSITKSLANLGVVTLPSGQHSPMVSRFAYSMAKGKKYAWVKKNYKPGLFGLKAWQDKPMDWSAIAYMVPKEAEACQRAAGIKDYTPAELDQHTPQPFGPRS